jgi:HEAT repeat protein
MKQQAQAWWQQATQLAEMARSQAGGFTAFVEQLAVRDPHVSVPALWALQQAGPLAIPALVAGLNHLHPRIRRNCVDIIDHGGYGGDARCIEALLTLLHDPVPHIRRAVWHTLFCERCVDGANCEVKPAVELDRVGLLIAVGLNDPNPKLRGQLIDELRHHRADHRAVQALARLDQENPSAGSNPLWQHERQA